MTSVRERNEADRARVEFSVLCWRGWCDYDFMIRDIANLLSFVTVRPYPPLSHLPPSKCSAPETCQCVCHDAERAVRAQLGETR